MTDTQTLLKELQKIEDLEILTDPKEILPYGKDWTKMDLTPNPCLVVFPKTVEQVSAVMKVCDRLNYPVVPSGGRTGLAGGAYAVTKELVLSLTKMNKLLELDEKNMSMTVEAGMVTQTAKMIAEESGFFFPVDLAAKGSCQVGGNVSTNAGGVKFVRFGGTRDHVLGLEVVLSNGDILDLNYKLRKDNSGVDLKHLFIGSEGTLGIITKVTLQLKPPLIGLSNMMMGLDNFSDILEVLSKCRTFGIQLTAFEFFEDSAACFVQKSFESLRFPFEKHYPLYGLIEFEEKDFDGACRLSELILEEQIVKDMVLSQSSDEFKNLWAFRENISEALSREKNLKKNDLSVPISSLGDCYKAIKNLPHNGINLVFFGHVADGNIHLNYVGEEKDSFAIFSKKALELENGIQKILQTLKGSVSAEHGIGLLKKEQLKAQKNPLHLKILKDLKQTFDPKGILNPGKIL